MFGYDVWIWCVDMMCGYEFLNQPRFLVVVFLCGLITWREELGSLETIGTSQWRVLEKEPTKSVVLLFFVLSLCYEWFRNYTISNLECEHWNLIGIDRVLLAMVGGLASVDPSLWSWLTGSFNRSCQHVGFESALWRQSRRMGGNTLSWYVQCLESCSQDQVERIIGRQRDSIVWVDCVEYRQCSIAIICR